MKYQNRIDKYVDPEGRAYFIGTIFTERFELTLKDSKSYSYHRCVGVADAYIYELQQMEKAIKFRYLLTAHRPFRMFGGYDV